MKIPGESLLATQVEVQGGGVVSWVNEGWRLASKHVSHGGLEQKLKIKVHLTKQNLLFHRMCGGSWVG